jgi:hypothetical protein
MKPQSFLLQAANYDLLAAGLLILGLILIPISARWGWPLSSAPSIAWMLALFVGARGYKISKERRLQQYADKIERRMRTPSN